MDDRTIDILIVNYNSTDCLLDCLGTIYSEQKNQQFRVRVRDNGSIDDPERILKRFPQVQLSLGKKNVGFAAGVNRGLRQSGAAYVMLLNPDAFFVDGFFDTILDYFEKSPTVGVIGPRIVDPDGTIQESARAFPNFLTGLFGRTSLFTRLLPGNRLSKRNLLSGGIWERERPARVDWVSGACMIVRREAIEQTGEMDEGFFLYWEDADWCRRMWDAGWEVVYYPGASVCHAVGKSSSSRSIRASLAFHRSAYRMFAKYAKGPARLMKPVVFGALAIRFYLLSARSLLLKL